MGLIGALRRRRRGGSGIRVRVMIRGRIGEGWLDVDEMLRLDPGATLADLLVAAERRGVPLRQALEDSPHLRETMMLNGERCRLEDHRERELRDGDQVYLLAPVAGG